jgi:transcriptional regulator with PAS, ATPase and Fis domain
MIQRIADTDAPVLIEGETGTGKELAARAIHYCGARQDRPFVPVNCGAIPESLFQNELFGHVRGAYTDAREPQPGLVALANGGTLFLDEISNTSPSVQAKLLRVLQEREVRRIGDTKGRSVDIRLIAASNANIEELVEKDRFRRDLLYRLKVLHIPLPPLRQRRVDIPEIARAFLERLNSTHQTRKRFAKSAMEQLVAGTFKGNVRELQNVVERSYFLATEATIRNVTVESGPSDRDDQSEVRGWFEELKEGRKDFWSAIHARYKKRDISREKVVALMDLGLRATRGSYKSVAALFQVKDSEYRKFMDFLRRNNCQPDFRLYRRLPRD